MKFWRRNTPPEHRHWESERSTIKGHEIASWHLNREDFIVCVMEHHHRGESRFMLGVDDGTFGEFQWLHFKSLGSALTTGEKLAEILESNGFIGYREADAKVRNPHSEL